MFTVHCQYSFIIQKQTKVCLRGVNKKTNKKEQSTDITTMNRFITSSFIDKSPRCPVLKPHIETSSFFVRCYCRLLIRFILWWEIVVSNEKKIYIYILNTFSLCVLYYSAPQLEDSMVVALTGPIRPFH